MPGTMWEAIGKDRMVQLIGPQDTLQDPWPKDQQGHQQDPLQAQASQTNAATPIPGLRAPDASIHSWGDLSSLG